MKDSASTSVESCTSSVPASVDCLLRTLGSRVSKPVGTPEIPVPGRDTVAAEGEDAAVGSSAASENARTEGSMGLVWQRVVLGG